MRNPLHRYYGQGDLHFITFSCYRRWPLLGSPQVRNRFVKILDEVRANQRFHLLGYVVMPEHVHMLISEPEKGNPSDALRTLKQRMSIAMSPRFKKKSKTQPAALKEITPTLWQPRFYDFNVRTGRKVQEKLDYMHANPVKRKLVDHCRDWPWSSWSHYEDGGKGLIRIDSLV